MAAVGVTQTRSITSITSTLSSPGGPATATVVYEDEIVSSQGNPPQTVTLSTTTLSASAPSSTSSTSVSPTTTTSLSGSATSTSNSGTTTAVTPVTSISSSNTVSTGRASTTPSTSLVPTSTDGTLPAASGPGNSTIGNTDSGVSGGAVAGAAIGAFIAGLLIAGLALFFFYNRKAKREKARSPGAAFTGAGYRDSDTVSPLSQVLLEPASDSDLKRSMKVLDTQIDQHVDNNYDMRSPSPAVNELAAALGAIGYLNSAPLARHIFNSTTRSSAIRHLIAWKLFSSIAPDSTSSILPPRIAALTASFPPSHSRGEQIYNTEDYNRVLSQWRPQTAYLLQSQTGRGNRNALQLNEAEITASVNNVVISLKSVLGPYISSQQQGSNLRAIAIEVAKLGLLLVSQPATYLFEWASSSNNNRATEKGMIVTGDESGRMVAFPGLVKTTDAQGRSLTSAKVISEPVTAEAY